MIGEEQRERYLDLLMRYLVEEDERYLLDIADLGREFVTFDIPLEEITELHELTLERLDHDRSSRGLILAYRPFMELMISYSLEFRHQADCRTNAEEDLRRANDELTRNVRKLEIYQRVFEALPLGV